MRTTRKRRLDIIINPILITSWNKAFCVSAYGLCSEYDIYALDVLYPKAATDSDAILVSLDKEDFTDRIKARRPPVSTLYVSELQPL